MKSGFQAYKTTAGQTTASGSQSSNASSVVATAVNRTAIGEGAVNDADAQITLGNTLVTQVVPGGSGTAQLGTSSRRWFSVNAQRTISDQFETKLPNGATQRLRIGNMLASDIGEMSNLPPTQGATTEWAIWEHTKPGYEASFIAHNGDTTVISSPADGGALNFIDEDNFSTYTGWQISATGSITAMSDMRLKQDVNDIELLGDLSRRFQQVRFVSYRQKSLSGPEKEDGRLRFQKTEYGVIAQEIQTLLPEVVSEFGSEPFLGVNYSHLNVVAMHVLQEQMARIEQLEKRVEALEQL